VSAGDFWGSFNAPEIIGDLIFSAPQHFHRNSVVVAAFYLTVDKGPS